MNVYLSPKKQRFLDFIRRFTQTQRRAPTFNEIMTGLQLKSPGTVQWYIRELVRDGLLMRGPSNAKRALAIADQNSTHHLPLVGYIAAGLPLETIETPEQIEVPASFADVRNYVLRVQGHSMTGDHIEDGDYVIIRQTPVAAYGQTVVALINNDATLKRYYPKPTGIELHPRNPDFPVIHVRPEDDFRIRGIVLAVWRLCN